MWKFPPQYAIHAKPSLDGPKCRSLTRVITAATAVDADGEGLKRGGPEAAAVVVKVGREPVVPRRSGAGQDPWLGDRLDDGVSKDQFNFG